MTLTEGTVSDIRSGLSTLTAQQVWEYGSRSLTSFGTLIADIWANATRTLTAFAFTPTPSNAADTTAIKQATDRLASLLETEEEQDRFTAFALSQAPGGEGGGSATLENQQAILAQLTAIQGTGWSAENDSLHALRESLRLTGIVLPEDFTGDPEQDLPTIRGQLYARLMAVLSSAKPNYSIDGQSVSWQSYQDMLLKQIQAVDLLIQGVNPFEATSRAKV